VSRPDTSSEPAGGPDDADTEGADSFAVELAAAFARLSPQGDLRWNTAAGFDALSAAVGPPAPSSELEVPVPEAPPPARRGWRQAADRLPRLAGSEAAEASRGPTPALVDVLEIFRFLLARVDHLEGALAAARAPVDGLAWLVEPPELAPWAKHLVELFGPGPAGGPLLHAECGGGALLAALAQAGLDVEGIEPRVPLAWDAHQRGLRVEVGEVAARLTARPEGTVGGLVLSGCVDRLPTEQLGHLVGQAVRCLAPGGRLVVLGSPPDAPELTWSPAAQDLVPGRPRHAETWALLLSRAGLEAVAAPAGPDADPSVAVTGVRGR